RDPASKPASSADRPRSLSRRVRRSSSEVRSAKEPKKRTGPMSIAHERRPTTTAVRARRDRLLLPCSTATPFGIRSPCTSEYLRREKSNADELGPDSY